MLSISKSGAPLGQISGVTHIDTLYGFDILLPLQSFQRLINRRRMHIRLQFQLLCPNPFPRRLLYISI